MKNIALFAVTFLLIQAASFAGVDLGFTASRTPYDSYMSPVKQVLGTLSGGETSMNRVNDLMREGHSFRYSFTEPYVAATPERTAMTRSGDCKAKALWLCDQLGDKNVRFVVGKAHASSKMSHAWVMMETEGRWWILDCTNTSRPILADSVSPRDYIPQYSWTRNGTYRHMGAGGTVASVAGKRNSPVASADR